MDYPVWEIAIGGGMLMGVVAIAHVIAAHFAIGGGLIIAVTETLAVRRGDGELRELARRSSLVLILLSTVFGAVSGVAIWVVAGLISPAAIAALIRNYVWGWAIEWVFFIVELVAALLYFATWDRVSKRTHLLLIWVYFVAAYLSLVIINGIITFMLTPGQWLATRSFWDGFFNPTYWPSLLLRSGVVLVLASAFMLFPAMKAGVTARSRVVRVLGWWLVAGCLLAYGGYRWWESALPENVRGMLPGLEALSDTRRFLLWALTATLALGVLFLLAAPRWARPVSATLILLSAFAFFGGYERIREGARKPFLIHDYMFSNGLRVDQIARINEEGLAAVSGWVTSRPSDAESAPGRQIFRAQCAACHTVNGYQGIRELLPDDPDMIFGVLYVLREQGQAYVAAEAGRPVDKTSLDYPYMPPFVGTEEELAELAAFAGGLAAPSAPANKGGAER
jgi:mono/diheme cytochrome c family protein